MGELRRELVNQKDVVEFLRQIVREEIARNGANEKKRLFPTTTFVQFMKDYSINMSSQIAPATMSSYLESMKDFGKFLGNVSLQNVGPMDIERFLSAKRGKVSEYTVRRHYSSLASMFETAKKWRLISSNPFRQIKKPRVKETQAAHFSREEFQTLKQFIPDGVLKDISLCAVLTGMRLGELISLRWEQVDLDKKVIQVENSESFTTKNRKNRSIPMHPDVCRLLVDRQTKSSGENVFHEDGKQLNRLKVSRDFKRFVRKAGLGEELHFHSLRHTFASWLVEQGVSLYEVQKMMGHSSIMVTEKYSHLDVGNLHGSINKIGV